MDGYQGLLKEELGNITAEDLDDKNKPIELDKDSKFAAVKDFLGVYKEYLPKMTQMELATFFNGGANNHPGYKMIFNNIISKMIQSVLQDLGDFKDKLQMQTNQLNEGAKKYEAQLDVKEKQMEALKGGIDSKTRNLNKSNIRLQESRERLSDEATILNGSIQQYNKYTQDNHTLHQTKLNLLASNCYRKTHAFTKLQEQKNRLFEEIQKYITTIPSGDISALDALEVQIYSQSHELDKSQQDHDAVKEIQKHFSSMEKTINGQLATYIQTHSNSKLLVSGLISKRAQLLNANKQSWLGKLSTVKIEDPNLKKAVQGIIDKAKVSEFDFSRFKLDELQTALKTSQDNLLSKEDALSKSLQDMEEKL